MLFSPYLTGALAGFSDPENPDYSVVSDRFCTLKQLRRVYELYKAAIPCTQAPAQLKYGSVNSFKCRAVLTFDRIPYSTDAERWAFISGYVDMNATLRLRTEPETDLELEILSMHSPELLVDLFRFIAIPGILTDFSIIYRFTNVIDLIEKLVPDSSTYIQLKKIMFNGPERIGPCRVILRDEHAVLPTKARMSDVGYDLSVIRKHKDLCERTALYETGLVLRIPFRYYAEIVPRSSLSKSGYILTNSIGVIDRSYQGTVLVALTRVSDDAPELVFPFRCCQLIFRRQEFIDLVETLSHALEETTREDGGFGSSGV